MASRWNERAWYETQGTPVGQEGELGAGRGHIARTINRFALGRSLRGVAVGAMVGLMAIGGTGGALADDDDGVGGAGTTTVATQAPAAGMSVQVAGTDGTLQLAVYGVNDTGIAVQTEYGPGRYVLVDLKVEHVDDDGDDDDGVLFNTTRVRMQDDLGQRYDRVRFDADDDPGLANFRQLRGQELDDDDDARGWLAFAVADGASLTTISYRDDDGDDIGIADMTVASIRVDDDDDWDDDGLVDDDRSGAAPVSGTGVSVSGGGGGDDDDDGWDDDGWDDDDDGASAAPAGGTGGSTGGGDDDDWDDGSSGAVGGGGGGGYTGDDDDWDDDGDDDWDDDGYSGDDGGDDDWDDDGGDDDGDDD